MKLLERVLDSFIGKMVNIDNMQFRFVPGRGTTEAIFIICQFQEKYLAANKPLYIAFVNLEKFLTEFQGKYYGGLWGV